MGVRSTPNIAIEYVAKYMQILGVDVPPELIVVNNLGSPWLGLCHWRSSRPETTTIKLQKRILSHPSTLERVIAHEMVHHWEFLTLSEKDLRRIKMGINPISHGPKFETGAERINSFVAPDFVTKLSDASYEHEANKQEFYLLIMKMSHTSSRLGWAWATRTSPQISERIKRECGEHGAKIVKTTDERWTIGAKIARFGGMSVPPVNSELETELYRLFENEAGFLRE